MSTWKPDSALMRLKRAPTVDWVTVAPDLSRVLMLKLGIRRASGGAFAISMGDARLRLWTRTRRPGG